MPKLFMTGILIVMVVTLFNKGESIRCFVCRTDRDSGCDKNDIDLKYVKDCPKRPGYPTKGYCRKINQQLYFKHETSVTTIRECAYEKSDKPCYKSKWMKDVYQETCECDSDKCNRSAQHLPVYFLRLIIFIINLWIMRYLT